MSNTTVGKIIIILLVALAVSILVLTDFGASRQYHVYDCGMAEWHPDIPKEVKEACRKLNLEHNDIPKPRQYI